MKAKNISAPSSSQLNRIAWMDYDEFFDADPIVGIIWYADAPKEALESFALWHQGFEEGRAATSKSCRANSEYE